MSRDHWTEGGEGVQAEGISDGSIIWGEAGALPEDQEGEWLANKSDQVRREGGGGGGVLLVCVSGGPSWVGKGGDRTVCLLGGVATWSGHPGGVRWFRGRRGRGRVGGAVGRTRLSPSVWAAGGGGTGLQQRPPRDRRPLAAVQQ